MTSHPKANLQLIYVSDIKRSTNFYKMIFNADPVFTSPRYVTFDADENGKALFAIWTGGTTPDKKTPRFSEIGILLSSDEEVDQLFDKWKKNPEIKFAKELYTDVFGHTFIIEDPDGHLIRVSRVD
ncbi:MAG: VOC family protein [Chlamydiota bacterium]